MAEYRLRNVLTLQPLIATLLPFCAMLLLGGFWVSPQIEEETEARQRQIAQAVGMQVESYLASSAAMIRAASLIDTNHEFPHEHHQKQLTTLLEATSAISSLYVMASDGTVTEVVMSNGLGAHREDFRGVNLSRNPMFKLLAKDGGPRWSKTFLSVIDGGLVVAYGLRIEGSTLIGEVDLGYLTEFLRQLSSEEGLLIMVVDQAGQVVADNHGDYTAQQLNIGNFELVQRALQDKEFGTGQFEFAGRNMVGSVSPILSVDWQILVAKSSTSLYRTVVNICIVIVLGLLLALAIGILFSSLVARKLAFRFGELSAHAQDIAEGQISGDWPTSAIDEFRRLSNSLQVMANRLQDSETLYRTLFEELPDGVGLWEKDGSKVLEFNTAAYSLLGYNREEYEKLSVEDFNVFSEKTELAQIIRALEKQGTFRFETQQRTKTDELRTVHVTLQMIELAEKKLVLAINRDITDEKNAIMETEYLNELLSIFVKNSPIYTYIKEVTQTESRVVLASENYQEMIGIPGSEMNGKTMAELFPAELAEAMTADDWRVVSNGEILEVEEGLGGRNYTSIKFPIVQGDKTLLAGFTIDITERKKAEEDRLNFEKQLLHLQKLESLGVLAGGIAHDFNNILLAITGNADMALRRLSKGKTPDDHLKRIKTASGKAADLARQMLAYSGKGTLTTQALDLNHLLEEMLHILEVSISKNAMLKLDLHHPLPVLKADATQLRQVIMNLVINASEAIGDTSGEIKIATSFGHYAQDDFEPLLPDEEIEPGEFVCLEVADDGYGMSQETLEKLFEPFYTTKFTGRGLGMAAVQGIVRGHQGVIRIESEEGSGSRFRIYLPAAGGVVVPNESVKLQSIWSGTGTVLLVDDEESVRNIASEMLKELGFDVLIAVDGEDAIKAYTQQEGIDLVILDLTMPNMDGSECFKKLRELDPQVKVIISSGYSELGDAKTLMDEGLIGFIQKPYWLTTLREVLQLALKDDNKG